MASFTLKWYIISSFSLTRGDYFDGDQGDHGLMGTPLTPIRSLTEGTAQSLVFWLIFKYLLNYFN